MKAAVLGVGLIGGSLALSLRRNHTPPAIIGYDQDAASSALAEQLGVVDHSASTLEEAVAEADFIFLCAPVGANLELLRELARLPLKPDCLVSDTGSTKQAITELGWELLGVERFIGGHPMAGSHQSGVEAATGHLFENAYYVLTPHEQTPREHIQRLKNLLQGTKAQMVEMEPAMHDQIVGAISHLPHIIASALVNQVAQYNQSSPWYVQLAAGGFRDLTRIASSHPIMWRDISLQNREVLIRLIEDWEEGLRAVKQDLLNGDGEAIYHFFERARSFRQSIPERKKGMLPPLYECFVDIPDRPGIIGEIASLLGEEGINLTNIHINRDSREEIPGVLRLSFRHQHDLEQAITLLKEHRYAVYPSS